MTIQFEGSETQSPNTPHTTYSISWEKKMQSEHKLWAYSGFLSVCARAYMQAFSRAVIFEVVFGIRGDNLEVKTSALNQISKHAFPPSEIIEWDFS